jgi:hypothetical protein
MWKSVVLASILGLGFFAGIAGPRDSWVPAAQATKKGGGPGGNTGGCDGWGTAARCKTCGGDGCETVCVGHDQCTEYAVTEGVTCVATGQCASGGPFGGGGGVFIP